MTTNVERVEGGRVVWITGLSGAGKTTIAREVVRLLRETGTPCLHLDGDRLREALADPNYGYDRESRIKGALLYARLAAMCAEQGQVVVVSTISLFHLVHEWNRTRLPGYLEVLVEASESIRRERDPKGLYRDSAAGRLPSMGGIDLALEMPVEPHLVLTNEGGSESVTALARRVLDALGTPIPHGGDRNWT